MSDRDWPLRNIEEMKAVVLTVLDAPLKTSDEIHLFKRAIELINNEAPEYQTWLFKREIYMIAKYICELKSVPEPTLVLCEEGKQCELMIDALNVPGVISCRPFQKVTDEHYKLLFTKERV